jgi:hypothetical protein
VTTARTDGEHLLKIIATAVDTMTSPAWRGLEMHTDEVREVLGGLMDALIAFSIAAKVPPETLVACLRDCLAVADDDRPGIEGALTDVVARAILFAARYRREKREGRLDAAAEALRTGRVEGME